MIIAAHAGTGKTTLAKMYPDDFIDFVSMPYKYYLPELCDDNEANKANPNLELHEDWPRNYIEAIHETLKIGKILLIPPESSVLIFLELDQVPYFLCYPQRDAKQVYKKRYVERGNSDNFLDIFIGRWDAFMYALESNNCAAKHIVLEPHQYLSDVVEILKTSKIQKRLKPHILKRRLEL